jgi:hypothetical protein
MVIGREGYVCAHPNRDAAGNAVAPANKRKKCLRGSCMINPPDELQQ